MAPMAWERELNVARRLAAQAGGVALSLQARGIRTESKPDLSPVTAADRECERLIAHGLEEAFAEDGLIGEEGTLKAAASGRRWIIDPIDGTKDYVRGCPTWGVLIALEVQGEVVTGVCHLAAQGAMYFAARGGGAYVDGSRIRVSGVGEPAQAVLCVNSLNEVGEMPFAGRLLEWTQRFWSVRSFGGCQDAMMVAAGRADAWIEPHAAAWDLAPLKIILEEAGAAFFNFDGGSSIYGGNAAACVPALEAELRRFILGEPGGGG
jgi:fructose-1,6-bisphosphatase/inositol monophosphatase family enzyme